MVFFGELEPELAKLDRPGSSWSRDRVAWTSLQRHIKIIHHDIMSFANHNVVVDVPKDTEPVGSFKYVVVDYGNF